MRWLTVAARRLAIIGLCAVCAAAGLKERSPVSILEHAARNGLDIGQPQVPMVMGRDPGGTRGLDEDFGGRQPGFKLYGDDYDVNFVLVGESADQFMLPQAFDVVYGVHQAGSLEALLASDDDYLVIDQRAALTPLLPVIRLEVRSTCGGSPLAQITVEVETAATAEPNPPTQTLALFDYAAGEWEIVDERAATHEDAVVMVVVDDQPDRFIEPETHATALRLDWFDPGAVLFADWGVLVDRARWTAEFAAP